MKLPGKRLLVRLAGLLACGALGAAAIAQEDTSREVLPIPLPAFTGEITDNVMNATPHFRGRVTAPEGAPNVLLFMSDDVGFAMAETFGGPVPTPNLDRIAAAGVRFNRFHTTGVCSPSRAALLTGRNHHNAGVGYLSDLPNGFPGYGGKILRSTASIAQVLTLNGYNTAMFGKHHNVPTEERSDAGPFAAWPTGIGFEYFYGFVAGDTDQFQPNLYRGIQRAEPVAADGPVLEELIADDLIGWLHRQNSGDPEKPWFAYLAPGSTHAPHQVPADWVDRFRGQFDHGWDIERERIFERQLAAGIVPEGTVLTERPEAIPAWATLGPREREFASRSMEVAAAQLAFQDLQLGRIIDELERMGELDNTLIAIVGGDNGADAAGAELGTINELRTIGPAREPIELLHDNIEALGGPDTYGNYPAGWAWAMNTPFRWAKHHSSMLGGIRNGMVMAWGNQIARPGSVCSQFSHVIDIVPTILDAAGLPAPRIVLGTQQKPMDGISILGALEECQPSLPRTQYFEINGQYSLYHNGWFLSGDDHRLPWEFLPPTGPEPEIELTLYNLAQDFSQSRDLSSEYPEIFAEMQSLWRAEAMANNVFPLDHRFAAPRARAIMQPSGRDRFEFWGSGTSIPANLEPRVSGRSFTLTADISLTESDTSGVIAATGSKFGGWSFYLVDGRPAVMWAGSTDPAEMAAAISRQRLPVDTTELALRLEAGRPGAGGTLIVLADGSEMLRLDVPSNLIRPAGGGETFDIGFDMGVGVADYSTPQGRFEGEISRVVVTYD